MFLVNICYHKAIFEWSNYWHDKVGACLIKASNKQKRWKIIESWGRQLTAGQAPWCQSVQKTSMVMPQCGLAQYWHSCVWPGPHDCWSTTAPTGTTRRQHAEGRLRELWRLYVRSLSAAVNTFTTTMMSLTPERCAFTCNQLVTEFTVPHIWGAV